MGFFNGNYRSATAPIVHFWKSVWRTLKTIGLWTDSTETFYWDIGAPTLYGVAFEAQIQLFCLKQWTFLTNTVSRFSKKEICCDPTQQRPRNLWGYSSTSELCRWPEWWEEYATSGQGSFREWSPVGSRFSELLFLEFPGTATEQVRTCGFGRNSSSLDRAPKIRDSVRLNSLENFLVTLPSISSETWEMYFLSHF